MRLRSSSIDTTDSTTTIRCIMGPTRRSKISAKALLVHQHCETHTHTHNRSTAVRTVAIALTHQAVAEEPIPFSGYSELKHRRKKRVADRVYRPQGAPFALGTNNNNKKVKREEEKKNTNTNTQTRRTRTNKRQKRRKAEKSGKKRQDITGYR